MQSTPQVFGATITVKVVRARAEAIFEVHGYGPVIPMADRERIFNRYYRSSTQSNRAAGTGIGLSVAKRVAVIHGGYVWVTSERSGGGPRIFLQPSPGREEEACMRRCKLFAFLLSTTNPQSAGRFALRWRSLDSRWPGSPRGEEALQMLRTSSFDAVLLDVSMPGIGGVETLRRIRAFAPRLPVLMLTVRDKEEEKVEALDLGADDYVTKPAGTRKLIARSAHYGVRRVKSPIRAEDAPIGSANSS